ncbi:helix-turn-helix domain-containing protein [Paludibacterium sp. B53371]|uniref:helix-turn-helix domain-containing protein n=1 Tax=Paludibacterium sp. B53371 TaxID=2806263 RepID=UPI001C05275B|nr:helix-turn-helix domain-containing protein [Paludibacterium sp. B53371]
MTMRIAVLAFPGISPFHLSVPCVVFGDMRTQADDWVLQVCAESPGLLDTSVGLALGVEHDLSVLVQADMIIVPSWDPEVLPSASLLAALRQAHGRGARLVGLCLGAFVLAHAGVLDGLRASTHWACAEEFARRFPQVVLDERVLYVDEGQVVTSAGTAAGLDCCLHLLRQMIGAERANSVARRLVLSPQRQGGQAQFIEQPLPRAEGDMRLSGLIDWVRAHLAEPHTLDSLASRVLMSRRTFTRHFRRLTGTTVGAWLLNERLGQAQRLLERRTLSVEAVALQVGFAGAASLRQHFRQRFGVSPQQWRQAFAAVPGQNAP